MAKLNKVTAKVLSQFETLDHNILAKNPIPKNELKIKTVGKALTDIEWERFRAKYLIPKLKEVCERKNAGSGTICFMGELGIEAALILQNKYPDRFHFSIECEKQEIAAIALTAAQEMGLAISEVHYMDGSNHKVNINDPKMMMVLLDQAAKLL